MHVSGSFRVLMYSHDTYGLGHLTRTVRIATALRDRYPHASVLILTGSPVAPYLPLPAGADLVKLPSVVKAGAERYRSRDLEVRFSNIRRIRRDLIQKTAESFLPHLFLVDNVPMGMKKEILPALEWLRSATPSTRIVLDLRDILDDAETIRAAWQRDGVPAVLEEFYDAVFVLGDQKVFDATRAYGLPPAKTIHLGYAAPAPRRPADVPDRASPNGGGPRVLLTAGGGGDGAGFLRRALDGLCYPLAWGSEGRPRIEVVTGPLMDPEDRRDLAARAELAGAEIVEFVPDLPERMSRSDVVFAMAGYNTCCELLSHARSAVVVPRIAPRLEQFIRSRALAERGIVGMVDSIDAPPEAYADCLASILRRGPWISSAGLPEMDGLARLAQEAGRICPELERRSHRSSAGVPPIAGGAPPAAPSPSGARRLGLGLGSEDRGGAGGMPVSSREAAWYWPGAARSLRSIRG